VPAFGTGPEVDMDRGSDKHGPRLDEEIKHDTRGMTQGAPVDPRVEDFRKQEELEDAEPSESASEAPGERRTSRKPRKPTA
jgi:hypothetical protein